MLRLFTVVTAAGELLAHLAILVALAALSASLAYVVATTGPARYTPRGEL